eukprot:1272986-Amphidinium_carterae.1
MALLVNRGKRRAPHHVFTQHMGLTSIAAHKQSIVVARTSPQVKPRLILGASGVGATGIAGRKLKLGHKIPRDTIRALFDAWELEMDTVATNT